MSKEVLAEEKRRIYSLKEVRLPPHLGTGWSSCNLFALARTRAICDEDTFSGERERKASRVDGRRRSDCKEDEAAFCPDGGQGFHK